MTEVKQMAKRLADEKRHWLTPNVHITLSHFARTTNTLFEIDVVISLACGKREQHVTFSSQLFRHRLCSAAYKFHKFYSSFQ